MLKQFNQSKINILTLSCPEAFFEKNQIFVRIKCIVFYYSFNLNKVYKTIYFLFQNNIINLMKAKFYMKNIFFDLFGGFKKLIFFLKC